MARSFMDWAVGPLTPGRIGAVLGFVGGVLFLMLGRWALEGEIGNLYPMFAICVGGSVGTLLGWAVGRFVGRRRRTDDAE